MNADDIQRIVTSVSSKCIHHSNFDQAVNDIRTQLFVLQPGEILVVVGPSRVGKSRATRQALKELLGDATFDDHTSPFVWIDNENSQAAGEFSTRGFMLSACEAINHPIYGSRWPTNDEDWSKLQSTLTRTPEAVLRNAFEFGLKELAVRYLVIDEAHHVQYAKGGDAAAAKILDSWKCLAQKTGVVLVLVGSYALIDMLDLVPHMIGRQRRPLEFPRYRSISTEDVLAFEEVLTAYSADLVFEKSKVSLREWNKLLFEGSLGCVGHLSLWVRSALAWAVSRKEGGLSRRAFEATAFVASQFEALRQEIEDGEFAMTSNHGSPQPSRSNDGAQEKRTIRKTGSKSRPRSKPFQARTTRRARNGRA